MKCKHCGKPKDQHQARTGGCPGGRKNRTHGYAWFSSTQHFEPKQTKRTTKD